MVIVINTSITAPSGTAMLTMSIFGVSMYGEVADASVVIATSVYIIFILDGMCAEINQSEVSKKTLLL